MAVNGPPTELNRLIQMRELIRTADTMEKRRLVEAAIAAFCKRRQYNGSERREFMDILFRKYPYPPLRSEAPPLRKGNGNGNGH